MDCLLQHVTEGKIEGREVMGTRGRRCKQLLDYLKETRRYGKVKEESLYPTRWKIRFERSFDLSLRQTK
jgi:hypothetical protein